MAVQKSLSDITADGERVCVKAALSRDRANRVWDLHPGVHVMLAASFAAFLIILGSITMDRGMILPFVVFFTFLAAFFGVPAVFARVTPEQYGRFQSWSEFLDEEIDTGSGRLTGRSAVVQILTVPVLLVGWSAFVAVFWIAIR